MDFETFVNATIHKFIGGPLDGMEMLRPAGKIMWSEVMRNFYLRYYYEDVEDLPLRAWYKIGSHQEKRAANVPGQEDVTVISFTHIGNTSVSCSEPPDAEYNERKRAAEKRARQKAKEDAELDAYMEKCHRAYEEMLDEEEMLREAQEKFEQRLSSIRSWFKRVFRI